MQRSSRPPRWSAGRRLSFCSTAAFAAVVLSGCGGSSSDWPLPNGDLAGTRAARSSIDSRNVGELRVLWRRRLTTGVTFSGRVAATPLIVGNRVYVQDLDSNVLSLDRATGRIDWRRRLASPAGGPNGLAYDDGRLYGNTNVGVFALEASTGSVVWRRTLANAANPITLAPLAANGLVVTASIGASPGGRGAVVALDARTGTVRWRFGTIAQPWRHPNLASGGGVWQTPTLDRDGHLWFGTANPNPWGGSRAYPNGAMYPGPVPYTDSLVELDLKSGRLLWSSQATAHDVRDYDFQDPPVLSGNLVIGAGKAGRVIAWDRRTRRRVWSTPVGLHRNDRGELPRRQVSVCPGLLGGVETPLAVARGTVFVPVVNLCFPESALGTSLAGFLTADYAKGRGALVALDAATGARLWSRSLASPVFACATVANDVVFTVTYRGDVLAYRAGDGHPLWHATAPAAVNACPAVAGSLLVVAAGASYPEPRAASDEVVAYAVR